MVQKINLKNIKPRINAPGAGRPPKMENGRLRKIYVPDADWETLQAVGEGNGSLGARRLVDDHRNRNRTDSGNSEES